GSNVAHQYQTILTGAMGRKAPDTARRRPKDLKPCKPLFFTAFHHHFQSTRLILHRYFLPL
uniref:hypothetical protein n=1 Tax=Candidatus Limisoma sp. TaxID=3076476 RepID=UPI004028D2F3